MDIEMSQRGENPFEEPAGKLRDMDPEKAAGNAGAVWVPEDGGAGKVVLPVLSSQMRISLPDVSVDAEPGVDSFSLKLLALLYLSGSDGSRPTGEWVAYRDLAGGRFYEPVVKRSVEDPVAQKYGLDAPGFLVACTSAGGRPEPFADASCSFELFPKVPVAFLLWQADEEFPARVQVLFDSGSTHHLGAFDLRMGAQEIASRLLKWRRGEER
ncbi:MAG: DUF3786 domain-containing protein [Candidatus Geothermincolia bacterium]